MIAYLPSKGQQPLHWRKVRKCFDRLIDKVSLRFFIIITHSMNSVRVIINNGDEFCAKTLLDVN